METAAPGTWKSITAGILNIVVGVISIARVVALTIAVTATSLWHLLLHVVPPQDLPFVVPLVNTALVVLLVMSVVEAVASIAGGVLALRRRWWGWALTGSIFAALSVFPLGVASVAFVAVAKDEFS